MTPAKGTGFHPSDPDWTRGRAIAIAEADALARRQISMIRERAFEVVRYKIRKPRALLDMADAIRTTKTLVDA